MLWPLNQPTTGSGENEWVDTMFNYTHGLQIFMTLLGSNLGYRFATHGCVTV